MLDWRLIKNTFLFGIALVGVQGTIYLFQFVAAAQMAPVDYSKVRIVESLVAVIALLATFGIPSVALVSVGRAHLAHHRTRLIIRFLCITASFSALASIGFWIVTQGGFLRTELDGIVPIVLTLSTAMAFRLVLTAIVQSQQSFAALASLSTLACVLALGIYGLLTSLDAGQLTAWLCARIVLELTICLGLGGQLLFSLIKSTATTKTGIVESAEPSLGSLAKTALPIGASLVARSLIDNGPVLWLAAVGAPSLIVAQVGILVTMMTASLVPGLVVQGVAIPRLASTLSDRTSHSSYALLSTFVTLMTAVVFTCLIIISAYLLSWAEYANIPIIIICAGAIAAKMSASSMGGFFLVLDRGIIILTLNLFTLLIATLAAGLVLANQMTSNLTAMIGALLFIELSGASLYGFAVLVTAKCRSTKKLNDLKRL